MRQARKKRASYSSQLEYRSCDDYTTRDLAEQTANCQSSIPNYGIFSGFLSELFPDRDLIISIEVV